MTLLIEKPLALPPVEPIARADHAVTHALSAVAVPRVVATVAPKTSEQLAHGLRMEAHKAGFIAIDRMLHEGDDDRWH